MKQDGVSLVLQLSYKRLVVEDVSRKVKELAVVSPVDGLVSRVDVRDKDSVQASQMHLTDAVVLNL